MCGWKLPTLIHVQSTCVYARPTGGALTNSMAASMVITDESPIDPTPTAATTLLEKCVPSTASTSALISGSMTISQSHAMPLPPHLAHRIHVQGFELMVQLQHQGQSHR